MGRIFLFYAPLAAAAAFAVACALTECGRVKLVHRERHRAEDTARIVVVRSRRAFLIRNRVFRSVYEILRGTLEADHREHADADKQFFTSVGDGRKAFRKIASYFPGQRSTLVASEATARAAAGHASALTFRTQRGNLIWTLAVTKHAQDNTLMTELPTTGCRTPQLCMEQFCPTK